MKALAKTAAAAGLSLIDIDKPKPGPNDLLIKTTHTAICGTDLHIYNWDQWAAKTIAVPRVIGHEFVGVVEEIGEGVEGYRIGERVSGEGHITCELCRNCRAGKRHLCRTTLGLGIQIDGAFAEYFLLPAKNAYRIPDGIDDEIAAIFDPLGNAVHTSTCFSLVGEDVLITGAGPIGIMAAAIARHTGARHIVISDPNEYRLKIANSLSYNLRTVNPEKENLRDVMKSLDMKEGFDVGLEMSGNPDAFRSMLSTVNHGGGIALLGIFAKPVEIDWAEVIFKGLTIQGIYGRKMYDTWYTMTTLLQSGLDISPVITHRIDYQDFEKGFAMLNSGDAAKVIMSW
ncbi:L-threonine 3-dehydrogenase [bacterium J17]|nr:L-threonine 3-dehydrogenase [bacterium J17]